MLHDMKCWPEHFTAIVGGAKRCELRREDTRRFAVGDRLRLREWDPDRYAAAYAAAEAELAAQHPWEAYLARLPAARAAAEEAAYTGRTCLVRVTHVLRDPSGEWLQPDVTALSIVLEPDPGAPAERPSR